MAQPLLEFKAGRSQRREGSNFVDPEPTKGAIQIVRIDDLLHFQWKNRATGVVDEDLIIFPSEAEFLQAHGRTYILKFSSSSQRHFFWMQDLSPEKDAEYAAHVNGYLSDPEYEQADYEPAPSTSQAPAAAAAATGRAPGPFDGYTREQLDQLRALMAGVSVPATSTQAVEPPALLLSDLLTPANLAPLFAKPALLDAIFPHLPSDLPLTQPPSEDTIQQIVESPQFQAGVQSLDRALTTGLLGNFVVTLGLPEEAGLGVEPFLRAIIEQAKSSPPEPENMETD